MNLHSIITLMGIAFLGACSLSDLVKLDQPEEGQNLEFDAVNTIRGGIGLYHSSTDYLRQASSNVSYSVGIFTDELASRPSSSLESRSNILSLDSRTTGINIHGQSSLPLPAYFAIHRTRISAQQSRDILSQFEVDSLDRYIGVSYINEAYAILFLAENLCSGVPLSQARFNKDIEYTEGLTTVELFETAVLYFDSATMMLDSPSEYMDLVSMGKARAYIGLNNLTAANQSIDGIDRSFRYNLDYSVAANPVNGQIQNAFWTSTHVSGSNLINALEVIANEGNTGKHWYSRVPVMEDPRVPVSGGAGLISSVARQEKYIGGTVQFPLASGIEAALINAEYRLSVDDPMWIDVINELRSTVGIADTVAPSNRSEAVDLIFNERASWLYLQGTRLGDMRRLVRYYGRSAYDVYPSGAFSRGGMSITRYGEGWVFTPDEAEYSHNYKYRGCENINP